MVNVVISNNILAIANLLIDPEISHEKIKLRHLSTQKLSVRNRIVDIHNHFRASVNPPAKNMLKMVSFIFFSITYLQLKYF